MLGALRYVLAISLTAFWATIGMLTWPLSPSGRLYLWYARVWARMVLAVSGVRRDGALPASFDLGRPMVFMANHESLYDILTLFATIPTPVRMIAKRELARIPVFGWSMWMAGFVFVDRKRRQDALSSLSKAAEAVRGGKTLVVFPEGTRGDGSRLGPFKRGGFQLALDAGVPIVPVGIVGAGRVLPKHTLRPQPGVIAIRFGEPIEVGRDGDDARDRLMRKVRAEIERLVEEARGEKPGRGTGTGTFTGAAPSLGSAREPG